MDITEVSIDGWMNKEHVVYNTPNRKLFSHKQKAILPFQTTQMELESITLSEISQRKTNTLWFKLNMESEKKNPNHRNGDHIWGCQRRRLEAWENWVNVVKGDKLAVITERCSGDKMYRREITVHNTIYLKLTKRADLIRKGKKIYNHVRRWI